MDRAFAVLNSEYKYGHWNKSDIAPSGLGEARQTCEEFREYLLALYEPEQHSARSMSRKTAFQRVFLVLKDCHKLLKFSGFLRF